MGLWERIKGITGGNLQMGFGNARVKGMLPTQLAVRDAGDANNANLIVAPAVSPPSASAGGSDDFAATLTDLKERIILIEFSFNGTSPPAAGLNTGKFGFCHTGVWPATPAGSVVYDNGVALVPVNVYKMQQIATTDAVVGTVNLIANGTYIAQDAGAPYSWTLKGDGIGVGAGNDKTIELTLDFAPGTFDSTTVIPAGAIVKSAVLVVDTGYDGGAEIDVSMNGSPIVGLLGYIDNDASTPDIYETKPFVKLTAPTSGTVRATLSASGTPTMGAARVYVTFAVPLG